MVGDFKMTIVVIAHRLSTIRYANNIVVLSKGEILEQGTHDDLIAKKGAYHKLVERQLMTIKLGETVWSIKLIGSNPKSVCLSLVDAAACLLLDKSQIWL